MGFKAITSKNEIEAKKELQAKIDLIIADIRINESRENEFLGRIIKGSPLTSVILLSYFNEDLFHILNQASIQLPSLRLDVGGLPFYTDIFIK